MLDVMLRLPASLPHLLITGLPGRPVHHLQRQLEATSPRQPETLASLLDNEGNSALNSGNGTVLPRGMLYNTSITAYKAPPIFFAPDYNVMFSLFGLFFFLFSVYKVRTDVGINN